MEKEEEEMTIRFCFWCGTGFDRHSWKENFVCSVCHAIFIPPTAIKESQLTLEEAEVAFNKIPLTDRKALNAKKRNNSSKRI